MSSQISTSVVQDTKDSLAELLGAAWPVTARP